MVAIPDSVRTVLESGRLAHFVTLNNDGSPQVTCVWVGVRGHEIVTAHLFEHQKIKNVRRDKRVAFSMEAAGENEIGLANYLVVNGTARIEPGGAPELLQELAHRYMGPDVTFPPMPNPPEGFVMRITPQRFGGVGPWVA
jgi:PPOX class probable F420-dependent enzyme